MILYIILGVILYFLIAIPLALLFCHRFRELQKYYPEVRDEDNY